MEFAGRNGVDCQAAARLYEELESRYSEPWRRYHTLAHIEECLEELDLVRHGAEDPLALEWAIWYHDAVYDTRAGDNEEKSGSLARTRILEHALPLSMGKTVEELIAATAHTGQLLHRDGALLVDIDLSVLGRCWERYDIYRQAIREEYEWAEQSAFNAGRSAVLRGFLKRPTIYMNDYFRRKYEVQARLNMDRELALMAGSPSGPAHGAQVFPGEPDCC